jgi:hypothetical protein
MGLSGESGLPSTLLLTSCALCILFDSCFPNSVNTHTSHIAAMGLDNTVSNNNSSTDSNKFSAVSKSLNFEGFSNISYNLVNIYL